MFGDLYMFLEDLLADVVDLNIVWRFVPLSERFACICIVYYFM